MQHNRIEFTPTHAVTVTKTSRTILHNRAGNLSAQSFVIASNGASDLHLPELLIRLIEVGRWPLRATGPTMIQQQLCPSFTAEQVRRFAAEESIICLQPPPFPTIAQERAAGGCGDFWERFGALDQIVPERSVTIGDFGLGSDSPIILDFGRNALCPPVLRLRWHSDRPNEWVQGARDFQEFAEMLALTNGLK